jgi:hypothetical protein
MSDEVSTKEKSESPEVRAVETPACPIGGKGWLRGPLGMAICCGAPLLLVGAISLFGLSIGAIASGLLSLAAVLACPLGMYFMMRMMMNKKK